jgi:hypothetical protein
MPDLQRQSGVSKIKEAIWIFIPPPIKEIVVYIVVFLGQNIIHLKVVKGSGSRYMNLLIDYYSQ